MVISTAISLMSCPSSRGCLHKVVPACLHGGGRGGESPYNWKGQFILGRPRERTILEWRFSVPLWGRKQSSMWEGRPTQSATVTGIIYPIRRRHACGLVANYLTLCLKSDTPCCHFNIFTNPLMKCFALVSGEQPLSPLGFRHDAASHTYARI